MSCRTDRHVVGEDLVILCIRGRITAQDVNMLCGLLEQERSAVAIDLKDVLPRGPRGRKTPGGPRIEQSRTQKLPDLYP